MCAGTPQPAAPTPALAPAPIPASTASQNHTAGPATTTIQDPSSPDDGHRTPPTNATSGIN
jgi:hypothetical protein